MKLSYDAVKSPVATAAKTDILACFVPEPEAEFKRTVAPFRKALGARFDRLVTLGRFTGKKATTLTILPEGKLRADRLLLLGTGTDRSAETFRRAAALGAQAAATAKVKTIRFVIPAGSAPGAGAAPGAGGTAGTPGPADIAAAIAEGAILNSYRYDKYLTSKEKAGSTLRSVTIAGDKSNPAREIAGRLRKVRQIADSVILARDLGNAPGNELYPETLARAARDAGTRSGFKVTVWNEQRIEKTGLGGLMAVGAGSARPPRFIIMQHSGGAAARETIVLVGKGVTFDSGGISIKPASGMGEMKMDMSGAAAVIGALETASRLSLPIRVIGLVPSAENMLGGLSMRPGDIVTHYGGTTSEIDNTDAEGRLILADALAYASTFKPDAVIDLATLTGACVVALGNHATGMMGNDEQLLAQLKAAGERTFERVWPLPLFEEYERQIKSDVADVKNTGGRWGGAITAGLFLKKFIGKHPWAHLDIAGTAILEESHPYSPKGASGVGVRLLTEFLEQRCR